MAPRIAEVLEGYIDFIAPAALDTRWPPSGWGRLTPRSLSSKLKALRGPVERDDYGIAQVFYGQGSPAHTVGTHAFRFDYSEPETDARLAGSCSALALEFPLDLFATVSANHFVRFVRRVAETVPFFSGNAGLSFQFKWTLGPSNVVQNFIWKFRNTHLGVDGGGDYHMRSYMRGKCPSAHWLNLVGKTLVERLGRDDEVAPVLAKVETHRLMSGGLLLRSAELPPLGEIATGARDIGFMPDVARLLKRLRYEDPNYAGWSRPLEDFESVPTTPWVHATDEAPPFALSREPRGPTPRRKPKSAASNVEPTRAALSRARAKATDHFARDERYEAFLWLLVAADEGCSESRSQADLMIEHELLDSSEVAHAYCELGTWYQSANEVPRDLDRAGRWLERAANEGSEDAEARLAANAHN